MKKILPILITVAMTIVFVSCERSVTSVTLSQDTATLSVGDTLLLTATVSPRNATNDDVWWRSERSNVATVNNDGRVVAMLDGTTNIIVTTRDGNHRATCVVRVNPIIRTTGCTSTLPGWGESLGTVTFATDRTWTISGSGIIQIWSDAVTATACQKTTFNGGNRNFSRPEDSYFNADCRTNPDFPGDLFSWCAVVKFNDVLCPYPWRVPSRQDFVNLDIALGGDGSTSPYNLAGSYAQSQRYFNNWGGVLGGASGRTGTLHSQNIWAMYWSLSEVSEIDHWMELRPGDSQNNGVSLQFFSGIVHPSRWEDKSNGVAVRCVRDN